jgi:ribosomal protein S18 acetylase RimI-like enzyme
MQIRPYRDADWDSVREIYDVSKPDEMRGVVDASTIPPLASDASMLALFGDSHIIVMGNASDVMGFAGTRANSITWLFVHPRHRRKGVARALVLELIARIGGTITLNVAKSNEAAYNLYTHLGFTVEREFIGQFHGYSCPAARLRYEKAA